MKNSCHNCEERHPCCWGDCERYAEMKEVRNEMQKERKKERDALNFLMDNIRRTRSRKHVK